MPVVNYHSVNGQMVGQSTGTTFTQYLTDALGSVTATVNGKRVTNTYRYKPYGERLAKTGTGADPDFQWTGDTGSRVTGRSRAEQYNRARHYGTSQASWTSVDPLWPLTQAFTYVMGNPILMTDIYGTSPWFPKRMSCQQMNKYVYAYCNECYKMPTQHCRTKCHVLATLYYAECKSSLPRPGPGQFMPPPGGGIVAPRPAPKPRTGPRMILPINVLPIDPIWTTACCGKVAAEELINAHQKYGGFQDHLMHCVFYCKIWKRGCPAPAMTSEAIEALMNICKRTAPFSSWICLFLKDNIISDRDLRNNKIGIGCSAESASCEDCCAANAEDYRFYPEDEFPWIS